ncbi:cytochrome c peroxidase [Crateriforma conspicua]|uniref:Cytochrome c551 peroxidase n=1 Tax=Crateriforma conspicua TaxID=2527996 RepID=A0A5C5Y7W9_9PLAN|nr:cytochrome c peroxidase [Crateriforma conspicua]QDV62057.1 Cytochrome c551 peroxidase precursor [Crateriforma conspicua]TWT71776.1 Cytochrome c551 peroxidase precursor [Crateriforma conspicua]
MSLRQSIGLAEIQKERWSASIGRSSPICWIGIAVVMLMLVFADPNLRADDLLARAQSHFDIVPAPDAALVSSAKAELGRALFWDTRISVGGQVSCGSCHLPGSGGADPRRFSKRAKGDLTKRNSQTVFNAMFQDELRWLADRPSLQVQASGSLTGSLGHDDKESAEARLVELGYALRLKKVFGDGDDGSPIDQFGRAVAGYEKTLTTPADFDRYLSGDENALKTTQHKGLQLFMDIGCVDCHSGRLLGGQLMSVFGVFGDYWTATGSTNVDEGLHAKTKQPADRYRFRVPMLRNITATGPYFHDGSVGDLSQAVRVMAKVQLDRTLTDAECDAIVQFLDSLTGKVPRNFSPPDGE